VAVVGWQWDIRVRCVDAVILSGDKSEIGAYGSGSGCGSGSGSGWDGQAGGGHELRGRDGREAGRGEGACGFGQWLWSFVVAVA
jgi:hypothetical protein